MTINNQEISNKQTSYIRNPVTRNLAKSDLATSNLNRRQRTTAFAGEHRGASLATVVTGIAYGVLIGSLRCFKGLKLTLAAGRALTFEH